jgi:hypothetical protein
MKDTTKSKIKKILFIIVPLFIIILAGYTFYIFNLEKYTVQQDTLIFGQNKFSPGSFASFRVITLDHKTRTPIPDADIKIIAQSKAKEKKITFDLYTGKTNKYGTADIRFPVPELAEGDYDLIIDTRSKTGKDIIKKPVKIERTYKILLTTDKPLYQPGQTIHVRSLALSTLTSIPAENKEITIEVEDAKGNKVFKKKQAASKYGVVGMQFTLAHELNLGLYTVRAKIGNDASEKKVTVKRYVLPKFKIDFSTDKTYYMPGQSLKGSIAANYFFGKPANDADIDVNIYTYEIKMEQIANIKGKSDAKGNFSFQYALPDSFIGLPLEKGSSLIFFNISVTDQAKHKETVTRSVPIAEDPIEIEMIPESGSLALGIENILYVITTYPDGKPAETTLTIENQKIKTNHLGIAEMKLVPQGRQTSLEVLAEDDPGNKGSKRQNFSTGYPTENILVRTGKSIYEVGDSVHLQIFYNRDRGTVYIDVIKDKQTILTRALEIENKQASLTLDLDETMTGTLEIHGYKIYRRSDLVRDSKTIFVKQKKDIDLGIDTDKKTYLPGEKAKIRFSTKKNNQPIPAAIGVNIVDESVFALQEREAGFEKLYFALEKELLDPKYTIYGITLPDMLTEEPTGVDHNEKLHPKRDENNEKFLRGGPGGAVFSKSAPPGRRRQVENILFARAPSVDRFLIKADSRIEKARQVKEKKARYFKTLGKFLYWLILVIPFLIAGVTIFSYKDKTKTLLQELGLSVLILTGIILIAGFLLYWHVGYSRASILWILDIILIIITCFLAIWSDFKNYYKTFFLSWLLLPFGVFFLMLLLADRHHEFFLGIAVVFVLALIGSLVLLFRHTKKNKDPFSWNCVLYAIYIVLNILFILVMEVGNTETGPRVMKKVFWFGITALLVSITFLVYSLRVLKQKQKIAAAGAYLAIFIFILAAMGIGVNMISHIGGGINRMDFEAQWGGDDVEMIQEKMAPTSAIRRDVGDKKGKTAVVPGKEKPKVRQFFPETLYSNPLLITDETGNASVDVNIADSITTWRITALASSLRGDIGSNSKGMPVFRDFFIDIDLPVSLTQNDEVSIPIAVYNYLPQSQRVRLELVQNSWFQLMDTKEKTMAIGSNDVEVVYFRIKAKEIGVQKLTAYAYGTKESDAISRTIEIIPDGFEKRETVSDRLEGEINKTVTIPDGAIENSEKLFVKIYPGIFSQLVEGLDSMFMMPSGCFEQTSSTTYPNVLLLDYMKSTDQITPEIQLKAEQYISTGYQRLVSFESGTPGGWTWFGAPEPANLMLSAYGLMEFYDMNRVYEIDPAIINRTQQYILSQMKSDGSFEPEGRLHTGGLERSESSKMSSTGFVAWSLIHSGYTGIDKTVDFIKTNLELKQEDSYVLALCANVLAAYNKEDRFTMDVLNELDGRATKESKIIFWQTPDQYQGGQYRTAVSGGTGNMKDLETTALAAIAYIKANYRSTDVNKILTHIVNQKDSFGNWGSTFATILSLKALINSLAKDREGTDANIKIYAGDVEAAHLNITDENSDVLQMVDLKKYVKKGNNRVKITMSGKGNLFYQVVSSYYLKWTEKEERDIKKEKELISFDLGYDKTKSRTGDIVTADVKAWYNGEGFANFVVIDLGIPPGFSVLSEDLTTLKDRQVIEKYEITGRQIIIYVRNLDKEGISFTYRLKPKYPIKAKTPKSLVYDYYNPGIKDEVKPVEMEVIK